MNSSQKVDLKLDWCSHAAAKYAVERWHYSKTLPPPPRVSVGVWENTFFIGVVLFSRGACPHLLSPYGLQQTEGCEMTRVALTQHTTPVTRIISRAIMMLKKLSPTLRLIVSFADPMQGHTGIIYQAGNWVFVGDTSPDYFHIDKTGKKYHSRQVRRNGAPIKQYGQYRLTPDPRAMKLVETTGKHRYLFPLDAAMQKQIEPLRKPYPKRAKDQAATCPVALGGETPTRTLHSSQVVG